MKASPQKRGKTAQTPLAPRPNSGAQSTAGSAAAHRWTFLTNHAHVLIVLHGNSDLILREVAAQVGVTERAVQRIVQELEGEGYIRRQKIGRKNHYEVLTHQPLRHPLESHRTIGDLLNLIKPAPSTK